MGLAEPSRSTPQPEHQLQALHRIARLLADMSDPRAMFQAVLVVLERDLGMKRGTIALLMPEGDRVRVQAVAGQADARVDSDYRHGEGIIGRVIATGRPAVVERIDREPAFQNRIHRRSPEQIRGSSFVCVPISSAGQTMGSLCADVPRAGAQTLEPEQQTLSIVASMIAHGVRLQRDASAERLAFESENLRLRDALGEQFRPANMVGNAPAMHEVFTRIHQLAQADCPAVIRGEQGTGKQHAARAIHHGSARAGRPFIPIYCGGLSEGALEAELFGHGRADVHAFAMRRTGALERAAGGTVYLDELAALPTALQGRLARFVRDGIYRESDGATERQGDVRVIAGTTHDPDGLLRHGRLRQELYYRLSVLPITIPPLRERRDDILLLADFFVARYAERLDKPVRRISTSAINMLMAYHWPGNVRELENCIERAILVARENAIQGRDLPPSLQMPESRPPDAAGTMPERVAALERDMLTDALKRTGGNVAAAARELGITARVAGYKIRSLGIRL